MNWSVWEHLQVCNLKSYAKRYIDKICTKYVQQRLKVEIISLLTFVFSHVMKRDLEIAYEGEKTFLLNFTFPNFTYKWTTVRGHRF